SAAGAGLTGVSRLHLYAEGTREHRFICERALHLGKSPFAGVPVGLSRFGRNRNQCVPLAALLPAFGALSDAVQVFQADQALGVGFTDALADDMIGIQLQPSLSSAHGYQLPSS